MSSVPRIDSVAPAGRTKLMVLFVNGRKKVYDCAPLLNRPQFRLLREPAFFKAVKVDPGGYGVSWSDDIDLSEYELWTSGADSEDGDHSASPPRSTPDR